MRVLVTGGFGYIGGRLLEALREREGYQPTAHGRRVPHCLGDWVKGVDVRLADITQPDTLRGICDGIDAVVHLASANENKCAADPMYALGVNVQGTYHILQEALQAGTKRFIYLSTFHVYGPKAGPFFHEDLPPRPLNHYGITKLIAEYYVRQAGANTKMRTIIARLSNGFGVPLHPGIDRWTLVFNDLCLQAVRDGKIVLRSSGLQNRDFIPMGDIIEAVYRILEAPEEDLLYDVYQVGSGQSTSIREAADLVRRVYQQEYGVALTVETSDPVSGEVFEPVQFSIGRMGSLGYAPRSDWELETRRTLLFCKDHVRDITT